MEGPENPRYLPRKVSMNARATVTSIALLGLLYLAHGWTTARAEGTAAALVAKVCYSNQQVNKQINKLLDSGSNSFTDIHDTYVDLIQRHLANARDLRTSFALFVTNPGQTGPTASPGFYDATANSCARANRRLRKVLTVFTDGLSDDDAQRFTTTLDEAAAMFAARR
jgi:hypothetical protein